MKDVLPVVITMYGILRSTTAERISKLEHILFPYLIPVVSVKQLNFLENQKFVLGLESCSLRSN